MKMKKISALIMAIIMCSLFVPSYVLAADYVTFTAIDGKPGNNAKTENYTNLFDGKKASGKFTKYCVDSGDVYVVAKASEPVVVTGYTLTTGNDNRSYTGRNPKSWVFYGSDDYDEESNTGTWKKIHSVTNDTTMQDTNFTSFDFNFNNEAVYKYYKFEFTEDKGAGLIQLCEIEFTYSIPGHANFRAVEGKEANNKNENYANLFDGKKESGNFTKYCVDSTDNDVYVVVKASEPTVLTGYTFTTGNDTKENPGRNPKSWVLYGSNNYGETGQETTWTQIHSVTGDTTMQNVNFTPFNFTFENEKFYTYYKFKFTEDQGVNIIQLCEIEFDYTTEKHVWEETARTEPTCTKIGYIYRTCTECGLEQVTEIPALGHNWQETSRTEPNCFDSGIIVENCTVCDAQKETDLLPLGHTEGNDGLCGRCNQHIIKVGDTYYFDLQKAINEALSSRDVEILQNIAIDSTLTIGNKRTLELNGFTIKKVNGGRAITVNDTFTLKDSSKSHTGKIIGGAATGIGIDTNGGGVYVEEHGEFTMKGGTISECFAANSGGGVYVKENAKLNMSDGAAIENCTADNYGGGIMNYGTVTINNGKIINCTADSYGGGIAADGKYGGGKLDLSDSEIKKCTAVQSGGGGGIYAAQTTVTLKNCHIEENDAAGYGGGIFATNNSTMTITGSTVQKNTVNGDGGGMTLGLSNLTMTNTDINENISSGNGGGIYASFSSGITFDGGNINGNRANWGGGVYLHYGADFTMSAGSYISNNTASYNGGGVIINDMNKEDYPTFTMTGGTVSHNEALGDKSDGNGGGICGQKNAVINISGGEIQYNQAINGGGIHLINNSSANISGGYLSENTAKAGNGGGVYINDKSRLSLTGGNISRNYATGLGYGVYNNGTLNVSKTANVSGNCLESEDGASKVNNNIYLPAGKTITVVGEGLSTIRTDTGYISPALHVTAENGTARITDNCAKRNRKYFYSDNEDYAIAHKDGAIEILNGEYTVTFIYNAEHNDIKTSIAAAGYPVREPDGEAWDDAGRTFIGWQLNGEDYDLETPVTGNITLTPKFAEKGKTAVSADFNRFYVVELNKNATVYAAAYDKDGILINVHVDVINEKYFPISYSRLFEDIGLEDERTKQIKAFLWDEDMIPLCERAFVELK